MASWLVTSWTAIGGVALSALGIYLALVVLTRVSGLRSFSKMSSFDFAMTVAIGSVIASAVLTDSPPLLQAIAALTAIYAIQIGVAAIRKRLGWFEHLVDNDPLVLMTRDGMIRANMRKAQVTENDIWAKLREANVIRIDEVRAVVMESTGDISVLHGPADGEELEACLLTGVRDADRVQTVDRGNAGRYVD
ncbi:MAG TPA: DUF421 domain-containing protein [Bacteroidetes bacterium]|nr:DUF421 domain-containing protein [Bacteroidota bacterium]HIL58114.1 DUF421 domain-containing protein [Rhodothermales bacterium]